MATPSTGAAEHTPAAARRADDARAARDPVRLDGVDAARAVAVLGMLAAHLGPTWRDGAPEAWRVFEGPPALLFALVAGLSVGLARTTSAGLVRRGVVLVAIGVLIAEADSIIAVILPVSGALLILAPLVRRLPTTMLAVAAGALVLLAPVLLAAARERQPEPRGTLMAEYLLTPRDAGWTLAVSGAYPLLVWLCPFLLGLVLSRLDLRRTGTLLRIGAVALLGLGATRLAVLVVGDRSVPRAEAAEWLGTHPGGPQTPSTAWLVSAWPHAGTTLEVLTGVTLGTAVVVGLCLAVRGGRLRWAADAGRIALSVYVLQVLVFAWRPAVAYGSTAQQALKVLVAMGLVIAIAVLLRRLGRRAPLEALLRWVGRPVRGRRGTA